MHVKDAIKKRHSIRRFKDKIIPNKIIRQILEAARLAPSGNNVQPWRFRIIDKRKTIEKLKKVRAFKQDFVYTAPVIIVCCSDPDAYVPIKGRDRHNKQRAIRDISLACAFLILRATELGLGGCFVGWIDENKLKEVLNIPKHYIIPYVIPLGYADEFPKLRTRKKLKELII